MAAPTQHAVIAAAAPGRALARALLRALALVLLLVPCGFAAQSRTNFDHDTTGFELTGQHRDLPCESCHANAIFKGTPRACQDCHGVGTAIRATAKPSNHILSTDNCIACHAPIAWSPAVNFDHTQARGSCSTCHNGVQAQGKPPTHIVTDLECDACHTTLTWAGAVFTHQGVTGGCASCHDNVQAKGMPPTHIPVGTTAPVPCEGCHSTTNFATFAGTKINHLAVSALSCASCHETAAYLGMHPSTNTTAGDSRPNATLDKAHPVSGDCGQCHDTTTFASTALRPANHIPTNAPCSQCHTTSGNYAAYSVTGVHQGVTSCLTCHGPNVGPFANVAPLTAPSTHIPIGSLDCNGSGCHSTSNVNPGGFRLGAASVSAPTLSVAGHATVAAAVSACQSCHEAAPYLGMIASTATAAGDSRPTALDKNHPASGDCSGCHSTAPTFTSNVTSAGKPANHLPTSAPCAQCHTSGNYAAYSVAGVHQGVTSCLGCHGATLSFANITTVGTPANHIPIGALDCNGSGCHTTSNVNPGGFKLGTASINTPTLSVAGHTTVAGATAACQTCHETAPYLGMVASSAAAAGDSRPTRARQEPPNLRRLQRLPHQRPDVRDRRHAGRQARQPHPDHGAVRPMPHGRWQLQRLLGVRHAPGSHRLPELPRARGREQFHQRYDRHAPGQPHANRQPRLQRLRMPHDDERECRGLQDWQRQYFGPDAQCHRSHDCERCSTRVRDLPRGSALRRHAGQHRNRGRRTRAPRRSTPSIRPAGTAATATSRRQPSQPISCRAPPSRPITYRPPRCARSAIPAPATSRSIRSAVYTKASPPASAATGPPLGHSSTLRSSRPRPTTCRSGPLTATVPDATRRRT